MKLQVSWKQLSLGSLDVDDALLAPGRAAYVSLLLPDAVKATPPAPELVVTDAQGGRYRFDVDDDDARGSGGAGAPRGQRSLNGYVHR